MRGQTTTATSPPPKVTQWGKCQIRSLHVASQSPHIDLALFLDKVRLVSILWRSHEEVETGLLSSTSIDLWRLTNFHVGEKPWCASPMFSCGRNLLRLRLPTWLSHKSSLLTERRWRHLFGEFRRRKLGKPFCNLFRNCLRLCL